MKIAVVTICTIDLNFRNYTIANSRDYCERHGYDFILYEDKLDPTSATITNKTIAVLQNMDNYDWILMKDADSLFYNFNIKIENYIDDDYNYIGSFSQIPDTINLGHLLIKCNPDVKTELNKVLRVLREKVVVKGEQPIYNDFWECGLISPVKKLPKHMLNAHPFGKIDWNAEWGLAKEYLNEWGVPMEKLVELDANGFKFYEKFGDIKEDTFIIHYPGIFLKTCSYVTEREIIMAGGEIFNFSEKYLPEFIFMYNKIKGRLQPSPNSKKISPTNCKPRVKKSEMRKIKYKNPKRR